ncbi:hypothetical protein Ac2012v2_001360 [Leucoagaricus gongylophorus]
MQLASPGTHYRNFLNKFCFFTGSSLDHGEGRSITEDIHQEGFSRSQDEVHSILFESISSNTSPEDFATGCAGSGASTPMMSDVRRGSRAATPVPR